MDSQHPYSLLPHAFQISQEYPEQHLMSQWRYGLYLLQRRRIESMGDVFRLFALDGDLTLPVNFLEMVHEALHSPESLMWKRRILHLLLSQISEVCELHYAENIVHVEWFCAIVFWLVELRPPDEQTEESVTWRQVVDYSSWPGHLLPGQGDVTLKLTGPPEFLEGLRWAYLTVDLSVRCPVNYKNIKTSREQPSGSSAVRVQHLCDSLLTTTFVQWQDFVHVFQTMSTFFIPWTRKTHWDEDHVQVIAEFHLQRYTQPHNRLARLVGSSQLCKVSIHLPSPHLEGDILNSHNPHILTKTELDLHNRWSLIYGPHASAQEALRAQERYLLSDLVEAVKDRLIKQLYLGSQFYHPIACNITGALTHEYVYTSASRADLCDCVFASYWDVVDQAKPMLIPLRLGLLNSTVIPTTCLTEEEHVVHLDIEMGDQTFTDGCGEISQALARDIFAAYRAHWFGRPVGDKTSIDDLVSPLEINSNPEERASWISLNLPDWQHYEALYPDYCPSAFQVRFLGIKGMVVVSSEIDDERWVRFKGSMVKFCWQTQVEHSQEEIEYILYVAGISTPARSVRLSSELIFLFEMACPLANQEALESYLQLILCVCRSDCQERGLQELMNPQSQAVQFYEKMNDLAPVERQLVKRYGMMASSHFLSSVLRLSVPMPHSAHVYGVADHDRALAPDEVYIRISRNGEMFTVIGPVMITKTPALKADDLRIFHAVDRLDWTDLHDVVVFSVRGMTPPASQMASADLDGDQFYVMWDTSLVSLFTGSGYYAASEEREASPPESSDEEVEEEEEKTEEEERNAKERVMKRILEYKKFLDRIQEIQNNPARSFLDDTPHYGGSEFVHRMASAAVADKWPFWEESFRYSVVPALIEPVNSTRICHLGHLLGLRQMLCDLTDQEWSAFGAPAQLESLHAHALKMKVCDEIARWISRTFEAPKHGRWVRWTEVKDYLQKHIQLKSTGRIKLPAVPHYNPKGNSRKSRHSQSLFGHLYDSIVSQLGILCDACVGYNTPVLLTPQDHRFRLQLAILAHGRSPESLRSWLREQAIQLEGYVKGEQCPACTIRWSVFANTFADELASEDPFATLPWTLIRQCGLPQALPIMEQVNERVQGLNLWAWNVWELSKHPSLTRLSVALAALHAVHGSHEISSRFQAHWEPVLLYTLRVGIFLTQVLLESFCAPASSFLSADPSFLLETMPIAAILYKSIYQTVGGCCIQELLRAPNPHHPTCTLLETLRKLVPQTQQHPEIQSKMTVLQYQFEEFFSSPEEQKAIEVLPAGDPTLVELDFLFSPTFCEGHVHHLNGIRGDGLWIDMNYMTYDYLFKAMDRNGRYRIGHKTVFFLPSSSYPSLTQDWIIVYADDAGQEKLLREVNNCHSVHSIVYTDQTNWPSEHPPLLPPCCMESVDTEYLRTKDRILALRMGPTHTVEDQLSELFSEEEAVKIDEICLDMRHTFSTQLSGLPVCFQVILDEGHMNACKMGQKDKLFSSHTSSENAIAMEKLHYPIPLCNVLTPSLLSNMSEIKKLSLADCYLSGTIPEAIGSLRQLRILRLQKNQLRGQIPQAIGNLSWLQELNLSSNQLDGVIPPELGSLSELEHIVLSDNQLIGKIPTSLGELRCLKLLDLRKNMLTGYTPATLLRRPISLNLSENRLLDCVPTRRRCQPNS